MPYVHQKTRIALAPRIKGLSLKESPYGMGDAPFPCDPSDATCNASFLNAQVNSLPVSLNTNPLDLGGSSVPLIPATNSLSTWLQANQGTILLVGGGLFGLALLKGFGR